MKFGKALETNAEAMPEGWRPYVIQYKALKKKINAIVKELDDRGLPSPIIKSLLSQSMAGDMHRLEYSFDEDKEHLKTCIKVVIDDLDLGPDDANAFGPVQLSQEEQISKLFAHELHFLNSSASSSSSDLQEQLPVRDDQEGTVSLEDLLDDATTISEASEDVSAFEEEAAEEDIVHHATSSALDADAGAARDTMHGPVSGTSESSPLSLTRPLVPSPLQQELLPNSLPPQAPMETLVTPGVIREHESTAEDSDKRSHTPHGGSHPSSSKFLTTEEDGKRVLVIELTADTAFFDQLGDEISQLSKLQLANKHKFESKVEDLGKILTVVSSPNNKDMYTWREILRVYLDAQVFVGDQESDRSTRSSEKAQKQLQWFLTEMDRSKLVHKFKQPKSKIAFNTFFQLNSELITMKQFRELNQMAMTKILKKHDKRTNLTASSGFPKHLQNEPFYSDNISKSLTYTIGNQLVSIIPQPDDYACPICMSVAWKPIRLRCKHMFCVRCLIKAQRKNMIHCPVCRQPNSVSDADASNLDVSMMNFMKLYFPKEIKEKRKESNREQAAEEMEAFTGQRWSEVPDSACVIM
ncbi:hypothetical protein BGZ58_004017 [Dissophora ornata]|nr:hypothetical protein BGZ58_004017 [Dissophora ornata]